MSLCRQDHSFTIWMRRTYLVALKSGKSMDAMHRPMLGAYVTPTLEACCCARGVCVMLESPTNIHLLKARARDAFRVCFWKNFSHQRLHISSELRKFAAMHHTEPFFFPSLGRHRLHQALRHNWPQWIRSATLPHDNTRGSYYATLRLPSRSITFNPRHCTHSQVSISAL